MSQSGIRERDAVRDIEALFNPRSIAIVGASDDPEKYGNWLAVRAVVGARPVHLVNRSRSTVLGRPAVPSLAGLGEEVDLAVVTVSAAAFEEAVDDALRAGVRAIVGITSGLGELGGEHLVRQRALVQRVRQAGAVLLGPNCLGVLDHTAALDACANTFPVGTVGLVSQSGNIAVDVATRLADYGMGISRFASIGNQADVDCADLIDSMAAHDGTDAVAVYCEGFQDGRRFARAAARATAAGKPVVLLTVGRGAASVRGAASHTGAMVSSDVAIRSVCAAAGAELVTSPAEMADLLQALTRTALPAGPRVAVFADGGGHASLAGDAVEIRSLLVEPFSTETRALVAAELASAPGISNPIDTAGAGEKDIELFSRVSRILTGAADVDSVLLTGYFGGYRKYSTELGHAELRVARELADIATRSAKAFIAHLMFDTSPAAQVLREGGVAVYRDVETAAWVLERITARGGAAASGVPDVPPPSPPLTESGYTAARRQLASAGIPFVRAAEVSTREELRRAASRMRFPMVLKALGDEHKSDRGGVVLGIPDLSRLEEAWLDLRHRLGPPAVSVEEMADLTDCVEIIVGVRRDPSFGPVVLVGIGGVYTELLRDIRCALGPVTPAAARGLLLSLKGTWLLTGFRGRPAVDLDAAARVVSAVSLFAAAHPEIDEIECNPVAVTPKGATALDARIVLADPRP
ncbi:acetate--CoA ligase family protein [Streptomyces sp. NPDC002845]